MMTCNNYQKLTFVACIRDVTHLYLFWLSRIVFSDRYRHTLLTASQSSFLPQLYRVTSVLCTLRLLITIGLATADGIRQIDFGIRVTALTHTDRPLNPAHFYSAYVFFLVHFMLRVHSSQACNHAYMHVLYIIRPTILTCYVYTDWLVVMLFSIVDQLDSSSIGKGADY